MKNRDLDSQSTKKFKAFNLKIFTGIPGYIDDFVRMVDNGFGGTQTVKWFHNRSLFAFFLPLAVYTFIVWGPSLARNNADGLAWRGGFGALLLLAGAVVLQAGYFRSHYRGKMAWMHLGLIFILSLATYVIAGSDSFQASTSLYRHYYGLLAFMALLVAVPFAWGLRHLKLFQLPSEIIEDFQKNFDAERVLAQGKAKEPESWDVISAFISAVLRTPLHVVTPVAFLVLFMPPDHLKLLAGIATALSLMLIATSSYDSERDAFIRIVHHTLLTGGSLIVTLVITTLAILRLVGFDYVTTILDAGPNLIFLSYILSTYAVFWLYDFWVNQAILDLLGNLDNLKNGKGTIRRHGGGRFAVTPDGNKGRPRMFTPEAFLMRIAQTAKEETLRESMQKMAMKIEQRFRIFRAVCLLGLLLLLFLLGLCLHSLDQEPGLKAEVAAAGSNNGPIFNLTDHLMKPEQKPLVMLAASGGGTRAALYTTALLHGLAERNLLDRLVLASGVSGGSAA
ncbi:MAG: hypothetical protein HY879_00410, partial [Deltaproteobacteria bacterium]|nr:hypothetical protein [Deltaproteobacteria bacterium]